MERSRADSPLRRGRSPAGGRVPRSFYARDVHTVARDLLGRLLVHEDRGVIVAGRVVEVEAYGGESDPASHARPGPTARNAVMFGPPGHAYVYLCYGVHYCLNLVTGSPGRASAVLIRALEPRFGLERMAQRRGTRDLARLARGPGCLGQALGIDRTHNGLDLDRGTLWISRERTRHRGERVARSVRIGLSRGADRRWRYYLAGHPCVSGPPRLRVRAAGGVLR